MTVPEAATPATGGFTMHDRTIDAKINDLFKASPDDSFRLEVEGRNEDIHTSAASGPITTLMLAGSAMWDHQLLDDLSIVNAVRYYSGATQQSGPALTGVNFNFNIRGIADNSAVIYKMTMDDSLRASFARGIALPSELNFEQLGLVGSSSSRSTLVSNLNNQLTQVTESRLSWDHDFRDWGALGRISLFDKQSASAIALLPLQLLAALQPTCVHPTARSLPACQSLASQAELSGTVDGAELQLDHKGRDGLAWGFNYSLARLHPDATASAAGVVPALRNDEIDHKVNANLGYGRGDWTADIRLFYSSPVQSLVAETSPRPAAVLATGKDVVALSPHLSWSPQPCLVLDLAADNLWDYKESLIQRAPVTYFLSATIKY